MRRFFSGFILMHLMLFLSAQRKDTIPEIWRGNFQIANYSDTAMSEVDRIKIERKRAEDALRSLKSHGCVIVRLKTRQKNIDAYLKAGKTAIAEQILEEQNRENLKIYDQFKRFFFFCPYYFIYAKDTRAFLNGEKGLFLNSHLNYDTSIVRKHEFFVFVEDGLVMGDPNSVAAPTQGYKTIDERRTMRIDTMVIDPERIGRATSAATGGAAIGFLDSDLKPLQRPFPYATSIKMLSIQLGKAYGRLVVKKDYKEKVKEYRKKEKEQWKQP